MSTYVKFGLQIYCDPIYQPKTPFYTDSSALPLYLGEKVQIPPLAWEKKHQVRYSLSIFRKHSAEVGNLRNRGKSALLNRE